MSKWKIKKQWFAGCRNSLLYKISVLFGIQKSWTLERELYLYRG